MRRDRQAQQRERLAVAVRAAAATTLRRAEHQHRPRARSTSRRRALHQQQQRQQRQQCDRRDQSATRRARSRIAPSVFSADEHRAVHQRETRERERAERRCPSRSAANGEPDPVAVRVDRQAQHVVREQQADAQRGDPRAARRSPGPRLARQRRMSTLPRHSKATPRPINASRNSSNGRYAALSSAAYQPGKAANVAPTATISHTSLPSQTGPMVFSMTRRSVVVAAEHRQQHADAEVEALEEQVAEPQHGDHDEPERLQRRRLLLVRERRVGRPARRGPFCGSTPAYPGLGRSGGSGTNSTTASTP